MSIWHLEILCKSLCSSHNCCISPHASFLHSGQGLKKSVHGLLWMRRCGQLGELHCTSFLLVLLSGETPGVYCKNNSAVERARESKWGTRLYTKLSGFPYLCIPKKLLKWVNACILLIYQHAHISICHAVLLKLRLHFHCHWLGLTFFVSFRIFWVYWSYNTISLEFKKIIMSRMRNWFWTAIQY